MRVGVAGVGRMGAAIAAHLIEVGHDVTVWNRAPEKTKPLADAGAKVAKTPAELAAQSEAVVTILTNKDALAAVYEHPNGLLAGDPRAKLFVEMSTVQPHDEVALAEKVRAKGGIFVECPVGGTVGPARQGKLLGVAGATKEDFAKAKPSAPSAAHVAVWPSSVSPLRRRSAMRASSSTISSFIWILD